MAAGRRKKSRARNGKRLRILLADRHPIIRKSLRQVLERRGFSVVAEVSTGEEAVARALALAPDVAVLDMAMPVKNGIQAAQEIPSNLPKTKTILLSAQKDDYSVRHALQVGVHGFVIKSKYFEELTDAIYDVSEGNVYLSRHLSADIAQRYAVRKDSSAEAD